MGFKREKVGKREGCGLGLRRVYTLDLVAGFGFDEFIIDEETERLLVFAAVGRGKGGEEVGHGCASMSMWVQIR